MAWDTLAEMIILHQTTYCTRPVMYQNSLTNLTKELFVDDICDDKPVSESQYKPLKRE